LLRVNSLNIGYRADNLLIKNAEFEIHRGEFVALIGRNGTGKTTLLKTLIRHLKPINGDCYVDNEHLNSISNQELAKLISIVNTERIRVSYLKVSELLALGRFPHTNFMGKLSEKDIQIIEKTINDLNIQHLKEKQLTELSDGELQKVLIGRAIIQDTPVIMLDEPTTHLDLINRFQTFKLLKKLCEKQNKAILLSTHEIELAFNLADKIIYLNEEQELVIARTAEFITGDYINSTFEGDGITFDKEQKRFRYK